MADIATEAGVSDTLAYRYFRSKEALVEAAVREYGGAEIAELGAGSDRIENFPMLLSMLLDSNIRRFEQPGAMATTMGIYLRSWAEALHDGAIRREVVGRWRHNFDVAEGLVGRAQRRGEVPPGLDPRAVAWVLLATHYGLNMLAVLDPEIDLAQCKTVAVAMFTGLGPRDAAGADRRSGAAAEEGSG